MKRKYIYLLIAMCLVMTYIIYTNVYANNEVGAVSEEKEGTYGSSLAQYEAAIIYDKLIEAFIKEFGKNDGYPAGYPHNYAGTYIDDYGKLVIQISGNIDIKLLNEEYSSYVNVNNIKINDEYFKADKLSDVVVYEKVKYSLNKLNYMKDDAINILSKHFTVIGSYIDTFNNRIVLEIEKEEFNSYDNIDDIIGEYFRKDFPLIVRPAEIMELLRNQMDIVIF